MEIVLIILTFSNFIILWLTAAVIYTPACFKLKAMIDSINKDGELTRTKPKWFEWGMTAIDYWLINLPITEKYLRYQPIKMAVRRIRICRRIIAYTAVIGIVCGFMHLVFKV